MFQSFEKKGEPFKYFLRGKGREEKWKRFLVRAYEGKEITGSHVSSLHDALTHNEVTPVRIESLWFSR